MMSTWHDNADGHVQAAGRGPYGIEAKISHAICPRPRVKAHTSMHGQNDLTMDVLVSDAVLTFKKGTYACFS